MGGAWADIEQLVAAWLESCMPGVRLCNELPANLTSVLPLVRVVVVPGGGADRVTDSAVVDVEAFGADRTAAWQLAMQAHQHMMRAGGERAARGLDAVDCAGRPGWVDYGNPAVRRTIGTYTVTSRRRVSAS